MNATSVAGHEPAAMVYSHKSNRKHKHNTRNGIRYFNHWYNVYKCPICGLTAARKRQPIVCRGRTA